MRRGKKDNYKQLAGGAIAYEKEQIGKLKPGEMETVIRFIQAAAQNLLDEVSDDARAMQLGYGSPSVVDVNLQKLKNVEYSALRNELLKLVDAQKRAAAPVVDESARIERLLGK